MSCCMAFGFLPTAEPSEFPTGPPPKATNLNRRVWGLTERDLMIFLSEFTGNIKIEITIVINGGLYPGSVGLA